MFRNVLVAIDGSADADEALTQAIDLAQSERTLLTLITGVTHPPAVAYLGAGAPVVVAFEAHGRSNAEEVLRRARDRVPADITVTTLLTDRPIRPALIDQVKRGQHDLVVMGSRGLGAVRRALRGSVSHYVLDHSPVPLLIVHAKGGR
jgi:nucleotide-binding universal stress UspA family protein